MYLGVTKCKVLADVPYKLVSFSDDNENFGNVETWNT